MKKLLALLLVVAMVLTLAGCCIPVSECDLCGEVGLHSKRSTKFSSTKYPVCNDCYEQYSFMFD